jgi:hypothetical protein
MIIACLILQNKTRETDPAEFNVSCSNPLLHC